MQTIFTKEELRRALTAPAPRTVLVPTMGALHAGHASLLNQARELAGPQGRVVASVFLNPVQFDNAGDLAAYPSAPEADIALCEACGVDLVFMPAPDEMYSPDRSMRVEETHLANVLCGETRPGHFAGVCLVVAKLFNLVQPTDAVFGKKDYQQLAILRRMVRDLDIPVTLHGAEIVREPDGLALSSRNARLTPEHRAAAPALRRSLLAAKRLWENGSPAAKAYNAIVTELTPLPGVRLEYAHLADAETLHPLQDDHAPALLAAAVWFGDVRLIDNIELQRPDTC